MWLRTRVETLKNLSRGKGETTSFKTRGIKLPRIHFCKRYYDDLCACGNQIVYSRRCPIPGDGFIPIWNKLRPVDPTPQQNEFAQLLIGCSFAITLIQFSLYNSFCTYFCLQYRRDPERPQLFQLPCQNSALEPLPMVIVVDKKKRSISHPGCRNPRTLASLAF